ncbi:MAG: aldo/keto reductase [Alphaproteobacteria bacterium]
MAADLTASRKLGRTALTVAPICFGTSGLGNMPNTYGYEVDIERARATVRQIFDGPGSFLDTSRNYAEAEDRVGDVIRERGGIPAGFVVSTKLDRDMQTNAFDGDRARRSIEESLRKLNLDRVQLLHLHDPEYVPDMNQVTGPGGSLEALFRMKEEGLCDAVGLAAGRVDVMMPLLRDWPFDALISHNRFTLVNRNADAMFDLAHEKGIAVLNAAPFASGVLAKGTANYKRYVYQPASEATLEPVKRVEAICARHGVPAGAAALQFSMRDPRVTSTIVGVSKPERVAQAWEWARWPIGDEVWAELAQVPATGDDPEASRDYKPG